MTAIGAGEVGFSTDIPAVCGFRHLWKKKMAFFYCFFAAEAYALSGQPQLG